MLKLKDSVVKELFENYTIQPKIVYGDTDSVFINLNAKPKTATKILRTELVRICIGIGAIIEQ